MHSFSESEVFEWEHEKSALGLLAVRLFVNRCP
jgi:hypothetical protein